MIWTAALLAAFAAGRYSSRTTNDGPRAVNATSEQPLDIRTQREIRDAKESSSIPVDLHGSGNEVNMVTPPGKAPQLVPLEVPGVSTGRIAEFAEILAISNATDRHLRFANVLATLTPAEAKAMRRVFHNFGANGNHFYVEWYDFWVRWGQLDPAAALENAARENPQNKWVQDCARDALNGWARENPVAAAVWLNARRNDPLHEAAFTGYIAGIGDRDLTKATEIAVGTLTAGDPLLDSAMEKLADIAVGRGQLSGLTGWFDQLPPDAGEGSARRLAVQHVWTRLQRANNFERTAEWIGATATQSWRSDKCLIETARKYAERDPSEAMSWVISLPPSPADGLVTGLDQVSRRWAQKDLSAFEQWLEGETRSDITDRARAAYIPELMKRDPLKARAWIEMIKDENVRNSLGGTSSQLQQRPVSPRQNDSICP
jgi:hypothetical protein